MNFHQPMTVAADEAANWLIEHQASLPEDLRPKAIAAARQRSPALAMDQLMECLYAALKRLGGDLPDKPSALVALGSAAAQIVEGGFFDKADRAAKIIRVARREAGEIQGGNPANDPAIAPAYDVPPPIIETTPPPEPDPNDADVPFIEDPA